MRLALQVFRVWFVFWLLFFLTEQGSTRHVLRTESEVISICFVKLRRKGKCVDRVKHWKNGDISPLFPF